jgi:xanthine dehydrogenase large subunit
MLVRTARPSTRARCSMRWRACAALPSHPVQVECRRMGGGFGGKESQSAQFACIAALAAQRLRRPVKLRLDRDDDFMVTGRRHGFDYDYDVGFDEEGRVLGVEVTLIANAGPLGRPVGPVMSRALCHCRQRLLAARCRDARLLRPARTRRATPRSAASAVRRARSRSSSSLDKHRPTPAQVDPLDVRRANFYDRTTRQQTHALSASSSATTSCRRWSISSSQTSATASAASRRARTSMRQSPVLKRGLALTPVKFGISFNVKHLNQAGAWCTSTPTARSW